jgi:hypothetical protein
MSYLLPLLKVLPPHHWFVKLLRTAMYRVLVPDLLGAAG